jgi:hypothetical protein
VQGLTLPDVILVRKSYEDKRRRRRARGEQQQRAWRLKRLAVDVGEDDEAAAAAAAQQQQQHRGRGMSTLEQEQADMERFMQVWCKGMVGGTGPCSAVCSLKAGSCCLVAPRGRHGIVVCRGC